MPPPPHAVTTGVSRLDPDSDYYRQVVGAACLIILIVTLQLASLIAPRKHRKLNEHTKAAAQAHLALAVCSCVVALVAAGLNQLGRQWTYAVLSTFLSGTQMVDGIYTWERYRLTHPDYKPSRLIRAAVYLYIFVLLFLPFLTGWVFYALDPSDAKDRGYKRVSIYHPSPADVLFFICVFLYLGAIPARLLWDICFGCGMITRIHELRALIAETGVVDNEKSKALLALSRRTVVYIVISGALNLCILFPHHRVIPFDAVYCCLFNFSFGALTFFCYSSPSTGGALNRPARKRVAARWPNFNMTLSHRAHQPQEVQETSPAAIELAVAPSLLASIHVSSSEAHPASPGIVGPEEEEVEEGKA